MQNNSNKTVNKTTTTTTDTCNGWAELLKENGLDNLVAPSVKQYKPVINKDFTVDIEGPNYEY